MNEELIGKLILIGLGAYFAGGITWRFVRDRLALRWPSVTGKIVTSETTGKWETSSSSTGGTTISKMYTAQIEYAYTVNGREYLGDRFRPFKISSSSLRSAEKTAARLHLGKEVQVHHHPITPSISMLHQAALKPLWFSLILTLGLALIIAGAIWISNS